MLIRHTSPADGPLLLLPPPSSLLTQTSQKENCRNPVQTASDCFETINGQTCTFLRVRMSVCTLHIYYTSLSLPLILSSLHSLLLPSFFFSLYVINIYT